MKHVLALLLFICILCQSMVKLGVVAYYEYNKKYIAEKLCENRSKPQLKCCGKCYLNKQLKKAEKSTGEGTGKSTPPGKNHWAESSPFILPQIAFLTSPPSFVEALAPQSYYQQMPLAKVSGAVFHPPQA